MIVIPSLKLKDLLATIIECKETGTTLPINETNFAEFLEVFKIAIDETEGREQMEREYAQTHDKNGKEITGYESVKDYDESQQRQDNPMTEAERLGATQDKETGEWSV